MQLYFISAKGGHSATQIEQRQCKKMQCETQKKRRHQKKATYYHNRTIGPERSATNNRGPKLFLRAKPHPQFLRWYKTISWSLGSHDDPLTLNDSSRLTHKSRLNTKKKQRRVLNRYVLRDRWRFLFCQTTPL